MRVWHYAKDSVTGWLSVAFILVAAFWACESTKNPFTAGNVGPQVQTFAFKPDLNLPDASLRADSDSLKYEAGRRYPIELSYEDPEFKNSSDRKLRAQFELMTGKGKIVHDSFTNPSADSLAFDVPASFSGDIQFVPSQSGRVELKLTLSDGVKDSQGRTASTTFFENLAPVVRFSYRLVTQVNPYRVDFDASASVDRDGKIDAYLWSFGDNSNVVSTKSNVVQYEYKSSGTFSVRLRVRDTEGKVDSTEQVLTTQNQPPVAELRIDPASGKAPLDVSFNAGGSIDPDGQIASYNISFGDGNNAQTSSGTHRYERDGTFSVTLTVKDNLGLSSTASRTVQIATPPIAQLVVTPPSGSFPLRTFLDGSSSYDPLGGEIRAYRISINNQLAYTQKNVYHTFSTPATYLVTLEVENDRGLTGRVENTIAVTNTPPIADFIWSPPNPQPTVNVTFTSTGRDPDSTDAITNYAWNFDDGTTQSGSTLSSVVHEFNVSRKYFVRLTVTDRFNATTTKVDTLEVK